VKTKSLLDIKLGVGRYEAAEIWFCSPAAALDGYKNTGLKYKREHKYRMSEI
jgi:hypothetical protein